MALALILSGPDPVKQAEEVQAAEGCDLAQAIYRYRGNYHRFPDDLSEVESQSPPPPLTWHDWFYSRRGENFDVSKRLKRNRHLLIYSSDYWDGHLGWRVDYDDGENVIELKDVCGVSR